MKTTILYLYYNNKEAFEHLEKIGLNSHKIDKVFVDDGSKEPLIIGKNWINTKLLRIEEDIAWNQPQANNLGFNYIQKGKVIRLDIDHWFNLEDLDLLMQIEIPPKTIIKFNRIAHYKDKEPKQINSGKNIYIANVEDILAIGGYNLDFCGNYGYDDGELFYRMSKNNFKIITHESILINTTVYHHTKGLSRDATINKEKFDKIINGK